MSDYQYLGPCPESGRLLSVPRTAEAEAAAYQLMEQIGPLSEGKMLGVLLVAGGTILRAYSGCGQPPTRLGRVCPEEWVPPLVSYSPLEDDTLRELEQLKHQLQRLNRRPEFDQLAAARARWQEADQRLREAHLQARQQRQKLRHMDNVSPRLDQESRADGRERKMFKAERERELAPLREKVDQLERQMLECKRQRRELSRRLQSDLHARLRLFPGQPWSLASLFPGGPPTGTGQCCAPKLLHEAASRGLEPLAMAEFWWGPPGPAGDRHPGHFYAACPSRCQPLLGPLLASRHDWLRVLYQDAHLMAIDKPAGVLTVPGRAHWNRDCLLDRLQAIHPGIRPVHRLDLETSGLVLFALHPESQARLQKQFEKRQVQKSYLAVLQDPPKVPAGVIELAIHPDPERPGCYRPDPLGKPAQTRYRVLDARRLEFCPLSGRSHQLRIHARWGLGSPILGDPLYGSGGGRLHLHAQRLTFQHPIHETHMTLDCPPPF